VVLTRFLFSRLTDYVTMGMCVWDASRGKSGCWCFDLVHVREISWCAAVRRIGSDTKLDGCLVAEVERLHRENAAGAEPHSDPDVLSINHAPALDSGATRALRQMTKPPGHSGRLQRSKRGNKVVVVEN
jgi:hypothetical protein